MQAFFRRSCGSRIRSTAIRLARRQGRRRRCRGCVDIATSPAAPGGGAGFTIIELIVALVLGTLVITMVIPLMAGQRRSDPLAEVEVAAWQTTLANDLATLISQSRCGVPVINVQTDGVTGQRLDRLELQTFSRPASSSRGPSVARYAVETTPGEVGLSLVRYGEGWHDGMQSRHVVARGVTRFGVDVNAAVAADGEAADQSRMANERNSLTVEVGTAAGVTVAKFWARGTATVAAGRNTAPQAGGRDDAR